MSFIELNNSAGRFLYDNITGWEIFDRGDVSAWWVNNQIGQNKDCLNTYAEIKAKLLAENNRELLEHYAGQQMAAIRTRVKAGELISEEAAEVAVQDAKALIAELERVKA